MTRVLMVASEAAPLAKVGGLADVLGALPPALAKQGLEVAILLPLYQCVPRTQMQRLKDDFTIWLGNNHHPASLNLVEINGVRYYLLDAPHLYDRPHIYGAELGDYPDNHIRYAVLCQAAFRLIREVYPAQILHCHDWHASFAPVYLRSIWALDPTFFPVKTVLTIHNLAYQGIFDLHILPEIGLEGETAAINALEFNGKLNILKGGIVTAHRLTTVSPTYAREIQTPEFGAGLHSILQQRAADLVGILNGVDYEVWNPETDPFIKARYTVETIGKKQLCKQDLLTSVGLPDQPENTPVIGMISRLTGQKGLDLIEAAADELLQRNLCLVVLGTGEPHYEQFLRQLAQSHPDKVAVAIRFDEVLSHKIVAGADMILMPSRWEPCGLVQLYAMRYGTLPIARQVGGLTDTVDETIGFTFKEYTPQAMLHAIDRALELFQNPLAWRQRAQQAMQKDFSWNASARHYLELYNSLLSCNK